MADNLGLVDRFGLPGLVILGMGWAIYLLWSRHNATQDARIADLHAANRALADLTRETNAALNAAVAALGGGK